MRILLLGCLLLLPLIGCINPYRRPYSNDPMLRQRVAVNGLASPSVAMRVDEPSTPGVPKSLATPGTLAHRLIQLTPEDMPKLPELPPPPVPDADLVPEPKWALNAPAVPNPTPTNTPLLMPNNPPVQVMGEYGQGPNYAWLQGRIDRHYRGHYNLRYCDPTQADYWGGKVRLIEDRKLDGLEDGDVIFIEGEIIPRKADDSTELHDGYPSYRVRQVWMIQRAKS